jgi:DNA-binding response OmpR family regulator
MSLGAKPRQSVLVVDDDLHVAALLRVLLEGQDVQVDVAHSAQEALAAVDAAPPDLVILDYHLPSMNGVRVLRRLRRCPGARAMRVIMLTATVKDIRDAVEPEVDEFMTKPFAIGGLLAAVDRALRPQPAAA